MGCLVICNDNLNFRVKICRIAPEIMIHCVTFVFADVETGLLNQSQTQLLTTLAKKTFKNNMGKGEDAGNQYFLAYQRQKSLLELHLFLLSANAVCWVKLELPSFDKDLYHYLSLNIVLA